MKYHRLIAWVLVAFAMLTVGCQRSFPGSFVQPIEQAHSKGEWSRQRAFEAEIIVQFAGETMLEGTMLMTTDTAKARFDLNDGTVLVFDGSQAWVSPSTSEFEMARFHLRTWPYFVAAPYKLRDPGTFLQERGQLPLRASDSQPYEAAKLTFAQDVGDTPDDWYIVYRDPKTRRVTGLAYIVTYATDSREAQTNPHAVTYDSFRTVWGVPIPVEWNFWDWTEEVGIHGEPRGVVRLTNPRFVEPRAGLFERPVDAREDVLPR